MKLPGASLRGTFAKAYELLNKLNSRIGWDELLRCRSAVFVMEEEYRVEKAKKKSVIAMPKEIRKRQNRRIPAKKYKCLICIFEVDFFSLIAI